MDWRTLNHEYLVAAVAGGGFLLGMLLTALSRSKTSADNAEDPRDSQIRQLEADLRVKETKMREAAEKLKSREDEHEDSVGTVHDLEEVLAQREQELETLRQEVRAAVKKTKELRIELTERAAETIREKVKVKEYETELEVARAGSAVMAADFSAMQGDQVQEEQDSGGSHDDSGLDDLLDDESLLGGTSSS